MAEGASTSEALEGQPLTLKPGTVKTITLPCGTVITIYPGTHDGHGAPILFAPKGTKIKTERLTNGGE